MSVSALCILDSTGSAICARDYRGDVPLGALDAFFPVISELEESSKATPIFQHEGVTYVWMQHADIFLVALCQSNANAASTMSFLHKLLEVFKFYFKNVVEESIRDNFVTVYELLDEVMDFGFPQFTEGPILREYIKTEAHKLEDFVGKLFGSSDVKNPRELPPQVTGVGATWRKEGIFYQRNEVFLDCIEQFNLMVNSKGVIVHSELKGTLQMKAYLSGMPECKLGLNDKTMFSRQGRGGRSVDLEDIKFHQCVRLTQFDENRQIVFTPPDGEFQLMSYRLSQLELTPPFWVDCQKEQHGSSRIELLIKIRSQFKQKVQAQSVEVAVPCPPDIRNPVTKQNAGSCAYDASEDCLRWTIKNFPSDKEFFLRANLHLPSVKSEEIVTGRGPPIRVTFEIPYNVPSGLQVRYFKVFERSNYAALPWVRYITRSGSYEFRMP